MTRISKVLTKFPKSRSEEGNLWNFGIFVKLFARGYLRLLLNDIQAKLPEEYSEARIMLDALPRSLLIIEIGDNRLVGGLSIEPRNCGPVVFNFVRRFINSFLGQQYREFLLAGYKYYGLRAGARHQGPADGSKQEKKCCNLKLIYIKESIILLAAVN